MKLWLLIMAVCAMAGAAAITEEKLRSAQGDSGAWLMYGRNYSAWRYSELSQINTGNVAKLAPHWIFQTGAGPLEEHGRRSRMRRASGACAPRPSGSRAVP